ncbi:MAG: glycosyltransferase family 4 protein [Proteobacteria bacterium]|nr:glycosyltransferase family 4 protein [Pseudomonadota bacterium]
MTGLVLWIGAIAAGGICWATTGVVLRGLRRRAILDVPNPRSSHSEPKPRGGGIAVVGSIAMVWVTWSILGGVPAGWSPLLAGLAFLALVSWADDVRGMPVWVRLGAHVAAVAGGVSLLADGEMVFQGWLPLWLDRVAAAIAWLWFLNLYNFMDGIDGITAVETISIGGGLFVVATVTSSGHPAAALALVMAAAAAGFLPWNWSPARVFLGDVGSVPLGYLCGWLLLSAAVEGWWGVALILPLYYLADATITLARRLVRRERIWQAHANHFYQQAARRVASHARISLIIAAANLLLIGAAVASVGMVSAWPAMIFSAVLITVLLWYFASPA